MTAFELWLEQNGGQMVYGCSQLSSMGTIHRTWLFGPTAMPLQIGLIRIKDSNVVALRYPMVAPLPQSDFEQFANKLLQLGCSMDPSYQKISSSMGYIVPFSYGDANNGSNTTNQPSKATV